MRWKSKIFILSWKAVIDYNFGRHEDSSTLKSDIHLGLVASVNCHFFGLINPHVYLIEVYNCIILYTSLCHEFDLMGVENTAELKWATESGWNIFLYSI